MLLDKLLKEKNTTNEKGINCKFYPLFLKYIHTTTFSRQVGLNHQLRAPKSAAAAVGAEHAHHPLLSGSAECTDSMSRTQSGCIHTAGQFNTHGLLFQLPFEVLCNLSLEWCLSVPHQVEEPQEKLGKGGCSRQKLLTLGGSLIQRVKKTAFKGRKKNHPALKVCSSIVFILLHK